jgi:hypothetical protein
MINTGLVNTGLVNTGLVNTGLVSTGGRARRGPPSATTRAHPTA